MRRMVKASALLTAVLLLLTVTGCRNRDFSPSVPPNPPGRGKYPSDFQCWVVKNGQATDCLTEKAAAELFETVKKVYKKSDTTDRLPAKADGIMLVFCTGGTAPETTIPAYQLPNAQHYGVYTLYPDDTGSYSGVLLTANVSFFALKEGSYERLLEMVN